MILVAIIVLVLVAVNGVYVAAEFAIISARPSRLQRMAEAGHPVAPRLLGTIRDPNRLDAYISTAQVGISIVSIALAMYAEEELAHLLEAYLPAFPGLASGHVVAGVTALAIITYLHVVLGEMVPKSVALTEAETTAFRVALPMMVSRVLYWPVVTPLTWLGSLVLRLVGVPAVPSHERILTPDELGRVISQSTAGGLLMEHEGRMLLNIFGFGEQTVSDVMTARDEVETLPIDLDEETAVARLATSSHYRLPVTSADGYDVVGVLYLKDLIRWRSIRDGPFDLRRLVRAPLRVAPSTPVEDLLELFRTEHGRLAVAVDEGGRMAGIATFEDLAAQIVGVRRVADRPAI